ncbi:MAG: hypothetical protein KA222_00885, partial [Pseudoxanthomonas sp.]|nr:hypothetical protein [Pseudoxanthomonas sp.]
MAENTATSGTADRGLTGEPLESCLVGAGGIIGVPVRGLRGRVVHDERRSGRVTLALDPAPDAVGGQAVAMPASLHVLITIHAGKA